MGVGGWWEDQFIVIDKTIRVVIYLFKWAADHLYQNQKPRILTLDMQCARHVRSRWRQELLFSLDICSVICSGYTAPFIFARNRVKSCGDDVEIVIENNIFISRIKFNPNRILWNYACTQCLLLWHYDVRRWWPLFIFINISSNPSFSEKRSILFSMKERLSLVDEQKCLAERQFVYCFWICKNRESRSTEVLKKIENQKGTNI